MSKIILGLVVAMSVIWANMGESKKNEDFAENLTIKKNFIMEKQILPQQLFASINIQGSSMLRNIGELDSNNRKSITTTLNSVIAEVKKGKICNGGGYSITPIINYEKNNRRTIGQEVAFSLQCKFVESQMNEYNKLLSKINEIISKNKLLALPQPSVNFRIKQSEIALAKEELFNEFLAEVENLQVNYSKRLGKNCKISKIDTNDNYPSPAPRAMLNMSAMAYKSEAADSTHTSSPQADNIDVQLNIGVEMVCKD